MGSLNCCSTRCKDETPLLPGEAKWVEFAGLAEREADRVFELLDLDKNRKLEAEELEGANQKLKELGYHFTVSLEEFDLNKDGTVDLVEFRMAFRDQAKRRSSVLHSFVEKSPDFQAVVEKVWCCADADHSGAVDARELRALATDLAHRMGQKPPPESAVAALLARHDKNGDRVIGRDEFTSLIEELFKEVLVIGRLPGSGFPTAPACEDGSPCSQSNS